MVHGMRVVVSGRMQNDNYTNKKGEKVYGVSLKADDVEFADGKERQIMGRRRARLRPEQQILQMHQRAQMSKRSSGDEKCNTRHPEQPLRHPEQQRQLRIRAPQNRLPAEIHHSVRHLAEAR